MGASVHAPDGGARSARRSPALRGYLWLVTAAVGGGLAAMVWASPEVRGEIRVAAPWVLALFVAEMFPFPIWRDVRVSLGYPLVMFLAVLYQPGTVGLLALVGTGDPRELTGDSDLTRSLFNRAQVAAAAIAASAVFHAAGPGAELGPVSLAAAVAASLAQVGANMLLVGTAARLDYRVRAPEVARRLLVGESWLLQAAYVSLGILGAVMALLFREVGPWALAGLLPPLLALRHLLRAARDLERAEAELRHEAALHRVAEELAEHRRRERRELAAALHDEVSPDLTAAGLRIETARRRLEGSLPGAAAEVLAALETARAAQDRVRALIGELLEPAEGRGALRSSIGKLARQVEAEHGVKVVFDVEGVEGPAVVREVLFSVAREAVRNAVRHGEAGALEIAVRAGDGVALLSVADDGVGFDPAAAAAGDGRFGLRLIRERVEACGGSLSIVSSPGHGTVVSCEVPLVAAGVVAER